MRTAFVQTLETYAQKNNNILVLSGDLGYSVFEKFIQKFPDQFFNLGVGEANIVGVGAGLAKEGKIPLVYSIIPFITMRCFEQIRNDVCGHGLNMKIVGVGSGLGYAHLGVSHHAAEDIALMRTLPGMTVLSPADSHEVTASLTWSLQHRGPVYMRLGKKGEPAVHPRKVSFSKKPHGFVLKEGKDGVIFATGTIVYNALQAAIILEKQGYTFRVVSMPIIKPLDEKIVCDSAQRLKNIITIEEHSIIGGLGSAVAEVLLEKNIPIQYFKRIGIRDAFCRSIGNYDYLRDVVGLSPRKIAQQIKI